MSVDTVVIKAVCGVTVASMLTSACMRAPSCSDESICPYLSPNFTGIGSDGEPNIVVPNAKEKTLAERKTIVGWHDRIGRTRGGERINLGGDFPGESILPQYPGLTSTTSPADIKLFEEMTGLPYAELLENGILLTGRGMNRILPDINGLSPLDIIFREDIRFNLNQGIINSNGNLEIGIPGLEIHPDFSARTLLARESLPGGGPNRNTPFIHAIVWINGAFIAKENHGEISQIFRDIEDPALKFYLNLSNELWNIYLDILRVEYPDHYELVLERLKSFFDIPINVDGNDPKAWDEAGSTLGELLTLLQASEEGLLSSSSKQILAERVATIRTEMTIQEQLAKYDNDNAILQLRPKSKHARSIMHMREQTKRYTALIERKLQGKLPDDSRVSLLQELRMAHVIASGTDVIRDKYGRRVVDGDNDIYRLVAIHGVTIDELLRFHYITPEEAYIYRSIYPMMNNGIQVFVS